LAHDGSTPFGGFSVQNAGSNFVLVVGAEKLASIPEVQLVREGNGRVAGAQETARRRVREAVP
jgi:hypothetical protein